MTTVVKFVIGDSEKHEVVYSWDQMWGGRSITVDGVAIQKSRSILSFSLKQVNEFVVGTGEPHTVRIEKIRPLFLPGFRPQHIAAFVDGQQVAGAASSLTPQNIRTLWIMGIVAGLVVLLLAATTIFSIVRILTN